MKPAPGLVREAGRRGLAGAIVRPGYVTGDPVSGRSVTDDYLVRCSRRASSWATTPAIDNTINQVPVTHVAKVVVAAALGPPVAPLGVANVTSHPRLRFSEYVGALRTYGYAVAELPYRDWVPVVDAYVQQSCRRQGGVCAAAAAAHGDVGPAGQLQGARAGRRQRGRGCGCRQQPHRRLGRDGRGDGRRSGGTWRFWLQWASFRRRPPARAGRCRRGGAVGRPAAGAGAGGRAWRGQGVARRPPQPASQPKPSAAPPLQKKKKKEAEAKTKALPKRPRTLITTNWDGEEALQPEKNKNKIRQGKSKKQAGCIYFVLFHLNIRFFFVSFFLLAGHRPNGAPARWCLGPECLPKPCHGSAGTQTMLLAGHPRAAEHAPGCIII